MSRNDFAWLLGWITQFRLLFSLSIILLILVGVAGRLGYNPLTGLVLISLDCMLLMYTMSKITKRVQYAFTGVMLIGCGSLAVSLLHLYTTPPHPVMSPEMFQMVSNVVISVTAASGACAVFEGCRPSVEPR